MLARMGMSLSEGEDYGVVVNNERQFSVWSIDRKLPPGWSFTGPIGTREEMDALLRRQLVETVRLPSVPARRPRGLLHRQPDL